MGIDEISGAVTGFWARAKSALTGNLSALPTSPPSPARPAGDSVSFASKNQYFAGYACPDPGSSDPHSADPFALPQGDPETGEATEAKVWAPLVIAPETDG